MACETFGPPPCPEAFSSTSRMGAGPDWAACSAAANLNEWALRELVARCAAVQEAGDVVEIDAAMIVAEAHTEEAEYAGVRATLPSQLRTARVVLQAAQAPHSA